MNKAKSSFYIILLTLSGLITYYIIAPMSFGYDWEFNDVKECVERHSNLKLTNSWRHEDITLEDFGFYIQTANGRNIKLDIHEGSKVRRSTDKAEGLSVYVDYKNKHHALLPFSDSKIWSQVTDRELYSINDLLNVIDDVLDLVDKGQIELINYDWERTKHFIHVIYLDMTDNEKPNKSLE